jgi:outer membrane protein
MKKVLALVVFLGLLMASPLAYAQQALKVGTFDAERVSAESKRWAKEREAYDKRKAELQKAYEKKVAELNALKESFDKKAGMLSEQARKEKERDFQQKARELDRLAQDADTELKQLYKEGYLKLSKILQTVVKKLGQEGKYTLILEIGTVPYSSKELDITDQVIKAVDAAKE